MRPSVRVARRYSTIASFSSGGLSDPLKIGEFAGTRTGSLLSTSVNVVSKVSRKSLEPIAASAISVPPPVK